MAELIALWIDQRFDAPVVTVHGNGSHLVLPKQFRGTSLTQGGSAYAIVHHFLHVPLHLCVYTPDPKPWWTTRERLLDSLDRDAVKAFGGRWPTQEDGRLTLLLGQLPWTEQEDVLDWRILVGLSPVAYRDGEGPVVVPDPVAFGRLCSFNAEQFNRALNGWLPSFMRLDRTRPYAPLAASPTARRVSAPGFSCARPSPVLPARSAGASPRALDAALPARASAPPHDRAAAVASAHLPLPRRVVLAPHPSRRTFPPPPRGPTVRRVAWHRLFERRRRHTSPIPAACGPAPPRVAPAPAAWSRSLPRAKCVPLWYTLLMPVWPGWPWPEPGVRPWRSEMAGFPVPVTFLIQCEDLSFALIDVDSGTLLHDLTPADCLAFVGHNPQEPEDWPGARDLPTLLTRRAADWQPIGGYAEPEEDGMDSAQALTRTILETLEDFDSVLPPPATWRGDLAHTLYHQARDLELLQSLDDAFDTPFGWHFLAYQADDGMISPNSSTFPALYCRIFMAMAQ